MLNPNAPIPLYRQLADRLAAMIRAGEYTAGSRIPSEHQMAAHYDVGRPTIRQAVDVLVRRGLLSRKRGSGTFVCEPWQEVDLFSLDGTGAAFRKTGRPVTIRMLTPVVRRHIDGPSENPFQGTSAYTLSRLTCVEDDPVLVETIHLHAGLFDGIDRMDLTGRSLSAIAEAHFYLRPVGGRQSFRVAPVDGETAALLQLPVRTPVLWVSRWLHFLQIENGVYAQLWCRTDRFVFSQTIGGTGYA
ncbi:MAG: GntR family transcriptional regulator [Desulfatitalea sp.]|nr:GntR family transcriptional regulator [Desulfatitalea sp.]NNK01012.1 GntR family transcriptional regulator [Desulfatitalea sp.]